MRSDERGRSGPMCASSRPNGSRGNARWAATDARMVGSRRSGEGPDMTMGQTLWSPAPDARDTTRVGDFIRFVGRTRGLEFVDYDGLWQWSVTDLAGFWAAVWDYFGVIAHTPYTAVLSSDAMPGARWFEGATLNYAEHVLRGPA